MTNTTVSTGVTSTSLTLNDGDAASVYGTAFSTTVNSGGKEYVYSGGATSFTTVQSSGTEVVSSGGTAVSAMVSATGYELVSAGGTASFTTVSFDGTEDVSSGGTTVSTMLKGYVEYGQGVEIVSAGGAASFTTVSVGGVEEVLSGGTAVSTTVNLQGAEYVGGTAIFTTVNSGSAEEVYGGGTTSFGTVSYSGFEEIFPDGTAVSTTVRNGGTEIVSAAATASFTTVSNGGTEYVYSGGTTSFTTVSNGGTEFVALDGTTIGTTLNSDGTEYVYGGAASGTTVNSGASEYVGLGNFYSVLGTAISTTVNSGGFEVLSLGTASDTVMNVGGAIDVTRLSYTSGGSASVNTSGLLTVSVGGNNYSQQLAGDYADEHFQLAPDSGEGTLVTAEAGAPCYRNGTRILTARGEVPVEELLSGDLVPTVLGQTVVPIIWVGHRFVDCARHPKPRQIWPVRVAADAFGPGLPHRDLFLSPDHAVYVNEVLIPVRHLINGSTITQVPVDQVTYYHIELAEHDVVLAEGLPAESFLDMRDGSNYANRLGPERLYPDYSAGMWEAFGCARLVVAGSELASARALVAGFATAVVESVAVTRDAA